MRRWLTSLLLLPIAPRQAVAAEPGLYDPIERTFTSARAWRNAFLEVDVDVTFTHADDRALQITLPAFWSGRDAAEHDQFTVRFAPTRIGGWTYETRSAQDSSLDRLTATSGRITTCSPLSDTSRAGIALSVPAKNRFRSSVSTKSSR